MKNVLITGANSYIGLSFKNWLAKEPEKYKVDSISLRGDLWKEKDFSQYDVLLHAAGIAHIKETKENKELYFKVNRDVAYEAAKKAKDEGIKQFIFLSSMSVYGKENGIIDLDTLPKPTSNYGESKLQAEKLIEMLDDDSFKVVTIRPPMIYGKGCKGNYPKLAKLARKLPVFPDVENERSMIHIENLCEFMKLIIDNNDAGLFLPQNDDFVKTSEMVRLIGETNGKRIKLTKFFNPVLNLFIGKIGVVNKVFGNLKYKKEISNYKDNYIINNFAESIRRTEE
ncbi:NAD-dependent epimerase/dehydratase family protein [Halalkalibacterium halodurans]|uniref:UDP-glucose 4-epimerase (Galactowaldenases) n=1 Tax=Halalkalibacterium halodurans (strain ATCC BAA-125 / DSM 18197 / FERM 7344 / JCM 9153 / C-125) TaxID=272558 RepID=Q9K6L4_HALH5|nr:NAD-dependent epimerase/dehydratase family protein [Halalkalibacterium halodurans]MED4170864.1 NAD-dependent epimerase/dehydratase family protein [Halalkalibacterium halodurans]BAB07434.1 UDP-glucose 4-epimerase (galactowaldenases) [Halalkalibacterium halodurans C-125]